MLDWIILMCVASGTRQRETEKHRSECFYTIEVVFHLEFLCDRTSLPRAWIHADESGCESLLHGGRIQKISCKLPGHKFVQRHILIERAHDPISIGVNASAVIKMKTVCVSITHRV